MISRRTIKAVEATIVIAGYTPGAPVSVQEVAGLLGLPTSYLESALRELKNHGIVRSHKGPGGGYQLDEKHRNISLWEIVKIFEMPTAEEAAADEKEHVLCFLEGELQQRLMDFFSSQALADLASRVELPVRKKAHVSNGFKLKSLPAPQLPRGASSIFQWSLTSSA